MNNTEKIEITYRQLNREDIVGEDQLTRIAKLIYNSDPYIYPCMFGDEDAAIDILTKAFHENLDGLFCFDNLFVAESDSKIVGVIIWKTGALNWDPTNMKAIMSEIGIPATSDFNRAVNEYFASYNCVPQNRISIHSVCVLNEYREYKIGQSMIRELMNQHTENEFELYVLKGNDIAIHVYEKFGFHITDEFNGFSKDHLHIPCYRMVSYPKQK